MAVVSLPEACVRERPKQVESRVEMHVNGFRRTLTPVQWGGKGCGPDPAMLVEGAKGPGCDPRLSKAAFESTL